jgi:molybdopterin-synthase adenylyltransferase
MTFMPLSSEEIARYARHIVLRHVGGPGQQKLKAASVLVIGAGGLGAPLIQYLAAAGVGRIGIVDDDIVSLSNLQRQVIHRTADIGREKVARAAEAAGEINPHVVIETHPLRISEANARSIIADYTIVADGSDNFDTRYAVSDACFHAGKPLVSAAVNEFDGSITTLRPFEMAANGKPNPTYRCLFPQKPPAGVIPTCSEAGVLGALTGMIGAMQAIEVIREIIGFGEGLVGKLLLIDALNGSFETIRYGWDAANPLNGH